MTEYAFFGLCSLFCDEVEAYKSKQRNLTYRTHSIYDFLKLISVKKKKKKAVSTDDQVEYHVGKMNSDLFNDELVKKNYLL